MLVGERHMLRTRERDHLLAVAGSMLDPYVAESV
jgi:hypothetical protein